MIISRDVYIDEELKLIISSLEEAINRTWSTKLLRSYMEGKTSVMNELYQELIKLEVLPYLHSTSLFNSSIINEVIGGKLLPGIIASTFIAVKSIKDKQLLEDIFRGKVKVAFSDVNLVPAADQADVIIVGNNMVWKEEAVVTPYSSLDNSMKICRVSFNKSQQIEFDANNAMVNISAQIVGAAEAVVNMSVEYAKNRVAFGKPIGSYQAIKHKLVDDAIAVELARSLYLEASKDIRVASVARYYAAKKLPKVIMDGIQVHGGIGFTDDIDIHLYLRRALTLGKIYHNVKPDIESIYFS